MFVLGSRLHDRSRVPQVKKGIEVARAHPTWRMRLVRVEAAQSASIFLTSLGNGNDRVEAQRVG